jgi:hypothetical protein
VEPDAEVSDCARTEESDESMMSALVMALGSVGLAVDGKTVGRFDEKVFNWGRYRDSSTARELPFVRGAVV